MHLQASLARLSGIHRRTIQKLIDAGAIRGFRVADEPRAFYPNLELEILRVMRPFAENDAPIGVLLFLAETFRNKLLNNAGYQREIAMARAGRSTWLIVQVIPTGATFRAEFLLATDARNLGRVSAERSASRPSVLLIIVDLSEALRPALRLAA